MGVPTSITKISRTEYEAIFRDRGLGSVVSPKLLTANDIVGYVRAMKQSTASAMLSLYRLCDGQAEALEFLALEGTPNLGVPFKDVRLRPNLLVACIGRNSEVIIPKGSDSIQKGDSVVVVTAAEQTISTLDDIFLPEVTE
jgi:trk system potassium uptake protein TrkA